MTQVQVAKKARVSRYFIYLLEHNQSGVTAKTLGRVIRAMGYTEVEFYSVEIPNGKAVA